MSIAPRSGAAVDPWPLGALSASARSACAHISAPVRLFASHTGPIYQLRAAVDQSTATFSPGPDGTLSTAELTSFAQGGALHLVEMYTQLGSTHLRQYSPTEQPAVSPTTKEHIYDGALSWGDITGCLTAGDVQTAYPAVTFVVRARRSATGADAFIGHRDSLTPHLQITTSNSFGIRGLHRAGGALRSITNPNTDTNYHTVACEANFLTGTLTEWVDGVLVGSTSLDMTGTLISAKTTVGAVFSPTLGTYLTGSIRGVGVFTQALSSPDMNLVTNVFGAL